MGSSQMLKIESLVSKMIGEFEKKQNEKQDVLEGKVLNFDEKIQSYI